MSGEQPRLVAVGPEHVEIRRGEHVLKIEGPIADRIAAWHAHMLTHGPEWAATYLAGVRDGIEAEWSRHAKQIIEQARRIRKRG